jgi:hypothetical protein
MDKTYKITLASQLFIIKELLTSMVLLTCCYFLLKWYYPGDDWEMAMYFMVGFLVFNLIPSFMIHVQYYRYNKGVSLQIDTVSRTMNVIQSGSQHSFRFNQIIKVNVELMNSLYRGARRGFATWEQYHYAAIEMEGGEKFFITCLLINDLRKFFKEVGVEAQNQRIFFPLILQYRHIDDGTAT